MRILILGGGGMLGHQLARTLHPRHAVAVTVRGSAADHRARAGAADLPCFDRVEARAPAAVQRAIGEFRPDAVVNCIGVVKQLAPADLAEATEINSLLPHRLAGWCRQGGARLVHISTDCVFSGRRGFYAETDPADADDWYGRTKLAGEVAHPHCLTLRTSFIGPELRQKNGLMEWFLSQTGTIRGYRRAIFSGLTTAELSRTLETILTDHPNLCGIRHVASDPIDKYMLLQLLRRHFDRDIAIEPDDQVVVDRSLDASLLRRETGGCPPSWAEMISRL
jgi:dTDP-4-dehydrorhamnose reductase